MFRDGKVWIAKNRTENLTNNRVKAKMPATSYIEAPRSAEGRLTTVNTAPGRFAHPHVARAPWVVRRREEGAASGVTQGKGGGSDARSQPHVEIYISGQRHGLGTSEHPPEGIVIVVVLSAGNRGVKGSSFGGMHR